MESNRHSIKTVIKHSKKRYRHHHKRTKKISQKIELKKQHFQYVINLNTTICEHEANRSKLNTKICESVSHQRKHESCQPPSLIREPFSFTSQCYSRMAPYCFREKCRGLVKNCRCQKIRERRDHVRDKMAKHRHLNSRKQRQDSQDRRRASKCSNRDHKHKHDSLKLSPISSSPLKDDLNHLYEDISNDSLDEVLETPMSYKNVIYVENKVESKLDTLIKRTKERERKLVAQSRNRLSYSISSDSNTSTGERPMNLESSDVSLHSQSTLILEKTQSDFINLRTDTEESQEYFSSPQSKLTMKEKYKSDGLYSLGCSIKNDFNMNVPGKHEQDQTYSTVSPILNDFNMNFPKKSEYDLEIDDIKPEPINIKTYSVEFDYSKEKIKKEIDIKSESFEMFNFYIKKEV